MTTVLVVDDSTADRTIASGLLRQGTDWQVVQASNGIEALDAIELARPDIVLTDMQMPEMDGLQLVTAIHADDPLLPVVLMTAAGSEEIAVEALRQGAASYVPKRLLAGALRPTLERILASAGSEARQARLMERMIASETSFEIENDLALVSTLVKHLVGGVGRNECLTVATALDEALLNAYYHGNLEVPSELRDDDDSAFHDLARQRLEIEPYATRHIRVTASVTPDRVHYVVADDGPGFEPDSLPDPTDPANIDRTHGRGLLLMKTFMDEVTFNDRGNEVTMIKARATAS